MLGDDDEQFIDEFLESREYRLGQMLGQPFEPPPEPDEEE